MGYNWDLIAIDKHKKLSDENKNNLIILDVMAHCNHESDGWSWWSSCQTQANMECFLLYA